MGKQKGRASSSGMAASLVPHAQGAVPTVGFGGYHGAVRVEPAAPSDPDAPIRLTPVCFLALPSLGLSTRLSTCLSSPVEEFAWLSSLITGSQIGYFLSAQAKPDEVLITSSNDSHVLCDSKEPESNWLYGLAVVGSWT